jgi:uncharacterized protein (DUF924 family)
MLRSIEGPNWRDQEAAEVRSMTDTIAEIHDFWFGELDANGLCKTDRNALWFGADAVTDAHCRERFGAALALALAGELNAWRATDPGLVALVVLLDQFSRNIHRGTAQAFSGDTLALAVAQDTIASGRHLRLPRIHRVFLYLPLEHSEDLAVQEQCVALYEELASGSDHPQFANFTRYARAHHEVIAKFGRFPHRNALVARQSTADELTYLEQHGGF